MKDDNHQLQLCVFCKKLFTSQQLHESKQPCLASQEIIDFHGQVIAEHVPDRSWEPDKFVSYLSKKGLRWDQIYWKVWALTVWFDCTACGQAFSGSDLNQCCYHPKTPLFTFSSNVGKYPCCDEKVLRFDTSVKVGGSGCLHREHVPDTRMSAEQM